MENETVATIDSGKISGVDEVDVSALSASQLIGAAAMGGYAKDGTEFAGAFVFNDVANTVRAGIVNGAEVDADGNVRVVASGVAGEARLDAIIGAKRDTAEYTLDRGEAPEPEEEGQIIADTRFGEQDGGELVIGVAVAGGAGENAAGVAFVGNTVRNEYGAVIEAATVNAKDVEVEAKDAATIIGAAAGLAWGSDKFAGMGSGVVNLVTTQVGARVGAAGKVPTSVTGDTLTVVARDATEIWSGAGSVSGTKGSTAIGAAVAFNATVDED
ncbi:MAG: hypothetical protein IRY96_07385, partial [Burkholderiales bacterium]|nr:hypothetical protein [Burkholderiales bacterium]